MDNSVLSFWGAVIAVVIGALLSVLGQFINSLVAYLREKWQWEREQKAERKKKEREKKRKKLEQVRSNYQTAIRSATTLKGLHEREDAEISPHRERSLLEELAESITDLVIHFRQVRPNYDKMTEIESVFYYATNDPLNHLNIIIRTIRGAIPDDPILISNIENKHDLDTDNGESNKREITIKISDDYRKEMFISGKEVPSNYTFEYDITNLPRTQRSFLADAFMRNGAIDDSITLALPIDERNMQNWKAYLDPREMSAEEIFDVWESKYRDAKKDVGSQEE